MPAALRYEIKSMSDQPLDKATHVAVLSEHAPVEPTRLVIVAVHVVVAELRASHFVAHQQHRRALCKQGQSQEILHLSIAKRLNRRVSGRAFDAAVPAQIVIGAVAVPLPVALIVLDVVGNEIVECEPIVAGDEVNTSFLLPFFGPINIWAGNKAVCEFGDGSFVALHKAADVVTKLSVPFLPRVTDEVAHLIKAARVPSLGDQFCSGEHWICLDIPNDGRVVHGTAHLITREDRSQIDTKIIEV